MVEKTPHFMVDSIVFGSANGNSVKVMLPQDEFEKRWQGTLYLDSSLTI